MINIWSTNSNYTVEDSWREWYTGDTLMLGIERDGYSNAYSFLVDKIEIMRDATCTTSSTITVTPRPATPLSYIPTESIHWMLIGIIIAISIPAVIFARRITSKGKGREEVSKQPITCEIPITS